MAPQDIAFDCLEDPQLSAQQQSYATGSKKIKPQGLVFGNTSLMEWSSIPNSGPPQEEMCELASELLCDNGSRRERRLRALQIPKARRAAPNFYKQKVAAILPEALEETIRKEVDTFGELMPSCPRFRTKAGREPLRRVLRAFVAADPEVGFEYHNFHDIALLVAGVVCTIDKEEDAFIGVRRVLEKFNMRGYYLPPTEHLKVSTSCLWQMVKRELPKVAKAFELDHEFDEEDCDERTLFRALARCWLRTLFVCSVGKQSFAQFVPLMHGIICANDELEPLHVAFAALRRYEKDFEKVADRKALQDLCVKLQTDMPVDAELLRNARCHDLVGDRVRGALTKLHDKLSPGHGEVREFVQDDTVGFGPDVPFKLMPGDEITQRFPIMCGGRYRLRVTLEALTWQAPNADGIHRTPVLCGVQPLEGYGSVPGERIYKGTYGFCITRTTNRALWGVAASDSGNGGVPQFFLGCLSRKIQFDLLLKKFLDKSSLEFIYNGTILASISWDSAVPVQFVISSPAERCARAESFLLDQSQKLVQGLTLGAKCKRVLLQWVPAMVHFDTYDAMLPRQFCSNEDAPNFILRDKSRTMRGFEFPSIGPGQEIEQEKGVIGAGEFRIKIRISDLMWTQGNQAVCPFHTESRLLKEYQGMDMALFVGMRFVEYFGIYLHRTPGTVNMYHGWLSSDSDSTFDVDGSGGPIELTFVLKKEPRSDALVSDAWLRVYHGKNLLCDTHQNVSSLIPASFRVKNGILIRTINSERHVYGSSCNLKFQWESIARIDEEQARQERVKAGQLEAEMKAKLEAERQAKVEQERLAKLEAEQKAKAEDERRAKEVAERRANQEKEWLAQKEAVRREKEEKDKAERLAREEKERKALEEAEQKAKERKALEDAEQKAKEEAKSAHEGAERTSREDAEGVTRDKQEAAAPAALPILGLAGEALKKKAEEATAAPKAAAEDKRD